jgi:transcriptional regulator with XRE-family HTH domain
MTIEKYQISLLIKQARIEKNLGQKQLAKKLEKSPVSISHLETGKVSVTAEELAKIADILDKPIEYFFGEDIGDKEIQDMVLILRRSAPDQKQASLQSIQMILKMQQTATHLKLNPDQEPTEKDLEEFVIAFMALRKYVNDITGTINGIATLLRPILEERGIHLETGID